MRVLFPGCGRGGLRGHHRKRGKRANGRRGAVWHEAFSEVIGSSSARLATRIRNNLDEPNTIHLAQPAGNRTWLPLFPTIPFAVQRMVGFDAFAVLCAMPSITKALTAYTFRVTKRGVATKNLARAAGVAITFFRTGLHASAIIGARTQGAKALTTNTSGAAARRRATRNPASSAGVAITSIQVLCIQALSQAVGALRTHAKALTANALCLAPGLAASEDAASPPGIKVTTLRSGSRNAFSMLRALRKNAKAIASYALCLPTVLVTRENTARTSCLSIA